MTQALEVQLLKPFKEPVSPLARTADGSGRNHSAVHPPFQIKHIAGRLDHENTFTLNSTALRKR